MNTLPFAQIGMWGFSLVSLFTLCLGGLGVLDQGADFTWRDSDVLVRFFFPFFFLSFSYWDSVSRTNMCLLHSVWEGPLHCRKVEKRSRTLFCRCMQSAWYVKNGIQHTHTHTHEHTHTHTHILAMAPSGGSTSLGPQAHETEDLLAITGDDILNWTPHRLRRQCFQFGLVGDAPEGDLSTLREVFLEHWRTAVAASQAAAPQGTTQYAISMTGLRNKDAGSATSWLSQSHRTRSRNLCAGSCHSSCVRALLRRL